MTDRSLPDGWRWVRFGDVVRQVKQTTKDPEADGLTRIVGLDHLDSESLPLRRWNELADLPDGTSFTRIFRAGQVLFGKRRAYQRKVAVADFGGVCSGDILVFEPSTDELLPQFLPHVVQSDGFFDHALGTSAGSLSPRTKWQVLVDYEFGLPGVEEQEAVAGLLARSFEQADAYRQVTCALSDLRLALVHQASADTRSRAGLGAFGELSRGSSFPFDDVDPAGDTPFLKVADLGEQVDVGPITRGKHYVRRRSIESTGKSPLPAGSVLFQRVGASLRHDRKWQLGVEAFVDENILALTPAPDVDPIALFALVQNESLVPLLQEGAVPSINEQALRDLTVPNLTMGQQQELGAQLLVLESVLAAAREAEPRARTLTSALRAELLRGNAHV